MKQLYSKTLLRKLRNDVPIKILISDVLNINNKISEGYFRFLCPVCSEFNTAINPKTNLARCFSCQRNFNPIDMAIITKSYSFSQAVEWLIRIFRIN
mgnify:CR=1 FL=1